jgi:hypothetical protein
VEPEADALPWGDADVAEEEEENFEELEDYCLESTQLRVEAGEKRPSSQQHE